MIMVKEEFYMDCFWLLILNTVSLSMKKVYYHKKNTYKGYDQNMVGINFKNFLD